jgi:thymidylate kinase
MKTGTIIAYSGTHGTGKTTSVLLRAADLKEQYPGLRVEHYSENVAWCPYPVNMNMTEESQLWIFTNQIQAELKLLTLFDIIVSDRTVVDSIAYAMVMGFNELADSMMTLARHHVYRYSEIYFMTIKNNNHHHADGLRDEDPSFRAKVEEALFQLYRQLGCNLIVS